MRLEPLHNRLIVERKKAPDKTKGGLFIPDQSQEVLPRGVVTAAGPGRRNEDGTFWPMQVQVGDEILFAKYAGMEETIDGKEILILTEDEVLAVVRD